MVSIPIQPFWYSSRPSVVVHAGLTSGQSNLTTGRIAAVHGQFNDIRQVAPVCTPPTRFLWPTRVLNSNGISIGSAVLAQLTAQRQYTYNGTPFHT